MNLPHNYTFEVLLDEVWRVVVLMYGVKRSDALRTQQRVVSRFRGSFVRISRDGVVKRIIDPNPSVDSAFPSLSFTKKRVLSTFALSGCENRLSHRYSVTDGPLNRKIHETCPPPTECRPV